MGYAGSPCGVSIQVENPSDPIIVGGASIERVKTIENDPARYISRWISGSDLGEVISARGDVHMVAVDGAGPDEPGISVTILLKG